MTLPFENDTSRIVKRLAKQNMKANRRTSISIMVAILIASTFLCSLSTILIFEIFRSGIAVAIKQAPTAKRVASRMGMTGIATSWRVSLVAASMKIVQTYPSTLPITEAIIP